MFGGNFAPRGWAFCEGQLMPISQNTALFSLLGTTYGGDGRTTFGLPDLRGRVAVHPGQGSGLTRRSLGKKFGSQNKTLTPQGLYNHLHQFDVKKILSGENNADAVNTKMTLMYASVKNDTNVEKMNLTPSRGSMRFSRVQPGLAVNYIIALYGTYPSRN